MDHQSMSEQIARLLQIITVQKELLGVVLMKVDNLTNQVEMLKAQGSTDKIVVINLIDMYNEQVEDNEATSQGTFKIAKTIISSILQNTEQFIQDHLMRDSPDEVEVSAFVTLENSQNCSTDDIYDGLVEMKQQVDDIEYCELDLSSQ